MSSYSPSVDLQKHTTRMVSGLTWTFFLDKANRFRIKEDKYQALLSSNSEYTYISVLIPYSCGIMVLNMARFISLPWYAFIKPDKICTTWQVYENFRGRNERSPGFFPKSTSYQSCTHPRVSVRGYKKRIIRWVARRVNALSGSTRTLLQLLECVP